jgi:TP901 family phage tail tape measure protein
MAVADIFIRIVTKGAELANQQMDKLGKVTGKLGGIAKTAGVAFGVALAAGVTKAVRSFVEFEDALNQSTAIMNVTEQQTIAMAQAAREVGSSSRIGASEAAEAFFFLASAGLDAEQSISALPQVTKFAQAGMFDMSLATDLATDAQSALGLTVKDANKNLENLTRVTDVLVKANTLANASVQQFSESLTNKAGAALKVVGKEIEEGVAVLAAFADRGVKGAEAGEKLNQILRDIPRATAKNSEEFAKLGLNMFDTEGNMKNVADIVEELDSVLGPMSDEMKAATLDQLGLNRGVADAVKILSGAGDQIRIFEDQLRDAGGTTEEVADKQLNSLQGQADELFNKFEVLGQLLVEKFQPALEDVIQGTSKFIDILINGLQNDNLEKDIEEQAESLAMLSGAFAGAFGVTQNFGQVQKDLAQALRDQRLNEQLDNQAKNTKAVQDSIDRAMPSFIDMRRETERNAVEQDMLVVSMMEVSEAVEEQTDKYQALTDEMINNQFNAIKAVINAEEAYHDILKDNQKLLDRRKEKEKDKTVVEEKLEKQLKKIQQIEENLANARVVATQITDEERLAILRQESAVQRLQDVEDKSELQKQELIVAQKRLNELREKAIGDDQNVLKLQRELESAEREQIRLLEDLEDAQEQLNEATEDYNEATAKTPANLLRIAEAKKTLDDAVKDLSAFESFGAGIQSIVDKAGGSVGELFLKVQEIIQMSTSGETPNLSGSGAKKSNSSTDNQFEQKVEKGTKAGLDSFQREQEATANILSDTRFVGGASGTTTVINLKNEFNIEGEINSSDVAIKVIEAQKRGLNVVL